MACLNNVPIVVHECVSYIALCSLTTGPYRFPSNVPNIKKSQSNTAPTFKRGQASEEESIRRDLPRRKQKERQSELYASYPSISNSTMSLFRYKYFPLPNTSREYLSLFLFHLAQLASLQIDQHRYLTSITNATLKMMVAVTGHIIERFQESDLLVNITYQELVPEHVLMGAEKKKQLLERYWLGRVSCRGSRR